MLQATLLNNVTRCGVRGCPADSVSRPDVLFFPLTRDPGRRQEWLRQMSRKGTDPTAEMDMKICSLHFRDVDIILSPFGNILKKSANPSRNMPALPDMTDASAQTEPPRTASHMTCQAGPALVTELRKRRKLFMDFEEAKNRLERLESKSDSAMLARFKQSCNKFLHKKLAEMVHALVDTEGKYTLDYRVFCLNLYYASPQAYRLISEDFKLPPISKLKELRLPMSTQISKDIMTVFHNKVKNMTETQKYCSVAVDVVRLKHNLFYSKKQDKVIGFHEIDGIQSPIPARYAVVLLVRGILVNWTQPIAYALLAATQCRETRKEVSRWIDKIIARLLKMGLKVKTFVCTAKTKLLNEANIRQVSVEKPYFFIDKAKIYYIYDFPHMFRMLRNHFITHDFCYNGSGESDRRATFSDVKDFYEIDKSRQIRVANVLTHQHINPSGDKKRDTRYARELLSKTVAVGIDTFINFKVMYEDANDTVDFLAMMSDLYEMLNSSSLSPNTFRGQENQINILNDISIFFHNLNFINSVPGQNVQPNLLFVKGILVTIKSVLLLFEDLSKDNFKHLLTARLSLAVTENFIKKIKTKGKKSVEPTTQRFVLKFRQMYGRHIMKAMSEGNISEDFSKAIAQICALSGSKEKETLDCLPSTSQQVHPMFPSSKGPINTSVSADFEVDEKELQQIARTAATNDSFIFVDMLLKKCLEHHNCEMLKCFVNSYEYVHNLVPIDVEMMPMKHESEELFSYIARMEDKFREVFESSRTSFGLASSVYKLFKTDVMLNTYAPCPCFPVELFQKIFIKVRIYMTLNYNNAIYRQKSNEDRIFFIPGL